MNGICDCGKCMQQTTFYKGKYRRFIQGHNARGKTRNFTDEHKQKIGLANSHIRKERIILKCNGCEGDIILTPQFKNRKFCNSTCANRYHARDSSIINKMRATKIKQYQNGKTVWNKNIPATKEHKQNQKDGFARRKQKGLGHCNKGRKKSLAERIKQSCDHLGIDIKDWKGFYTNKDYGKGFDEPLREQVRQRDNYCQMCFNYQDELRDKNKHCKLSVHHIDYNKKNNSPDNLISLCRSCHSKTNGKNNRPHWQLHFKTFKLYIS